MAEKELVEHAKLKPIESCSPNQWLKGVGKVTDKVKPEPAEMLSDDSLAYAQVQAQEAGVPVDDPLAAVKALRLGQLAVCRLKSEEEMQAMRDQLENNHGDTSGE